MPQIMLDNPELTKLQLKLNSPEIRKAKEVAFAALEAYTANEIALNQKYNLIQRKEHLINGLMAYRATWTESQRRLFKNLSNELNHLRHEVARLKEQF